MARYLLDEGEFDVPMLRRWAYDLDASLIEQDEDLLLHDWRLAEAILELIADPECPKSPCILNIWDDFTQRMTVYQDKNSLESAYMSLSLAEKYRSHSGINRWIDDQKSRLKYVDGIGHTDRDTALLIGETVLNSVKRSSKIEIIDENESTFLVQLSVSLGLYKEWLLIEKSSGKFRFSRYWPDGDLGPMWANPIRS